MNADQTGPGPGGASAQVERVLEHAPAVLRQRRQWVCWTFITRDDKPTKCPVSPRSGSNADSTNPATWATFDDAVAAWRSNGYAGVGYVFAAEDPFCGIDLDDCIDEAGIVVPAACAIIQSLDSYAEVSPSGRGVKVFIAGRKPEGVGCRSKAISGFKEIEIYDRDRFFTVTGQHLEGTPKTVEDRQQPLEELCHRLWPATAPESLPPPHPSPPGCPDDEQLLAKARAATNGETFSRLWEGDTSAYAGDDSAADMALSNALAFWTGKDAGRMDRLFRRSGLFRGKWDENRGARTYGQKTIEKAIADCRETYSPSRATSPSFPESAGPDQSEPGDGSDLLVPLGQPDPGSGRLVLSPRRTLPTADAYVREFNRHPDGRTLHGFGGLLVEWRGNRYCEVEDGSIKQRLQTWLHAALRYVANRRTGEMELADFESNPTTVNQALETLRSYVHLPASTTVPSWLCDDGTRPPALELLPCKSMNLHIPTGRVLAPTPALFTTNALEFDYDPNPEPPERWIKFLEQLFGDDLESTELLQEWMGYCLTADTSQQKMLLLVGPRRSGKGTIGRILTQVIGAGNVVGPTTSSLAGTFGLQPLIGKSLAIVSDARFGGDHVGTVVERLLCISGEDTLTIDRKFLGSVSMKLPTRFMFLTNELPRLNDASTALAGRFLVLRLNTSFYGHEDVTLTEQLFAELPGILLWAIEGWKRLHQRGRFVQPESGADAIRDMEDLASPVGAFIRDQCIIGVGHRAWVDDLYGAWKEWCVHDGRNAFSTKQAFGRDLMAVVPGLVRRRATGGVPFYEGIGLRTEAPE